MEKVDAEEQEEEQPRETEHKISVRNMLKKMGGNGDS